MYCTIYTDIHVLWHLRVPPRAIRSQALRGAAGGKSPRLVGPRVSPAWVKITVKTEAVPEGKVSGSSPVQRLAPASGPPVRPEPDLQPRRTGPEAGLSELHVSRSLGAPSAGRVL